MKTKENALSKNHKNKYKKVVYEEESDSKPEVEESQYTSVGDLIKKEKEEEKKQPAPKRKRKYDYLNKEAKTNKR